ncbi:MAG: glycine--tRNA ligase [Candidatus Aenigmatarchaeota archaeon]
MKQFFVCMKVVDKIVTLAKRRGFFWPAAEIYSPIAGFWNYGPLGVAIKNKLIELWRKWFVRDEGAYEIETTDILPEIVWIASGHIPSFVDKQTECTKCHNRFRADNLIEEKLKVKEKLEGASCEELTELIRKNKIVCPRCGGELSEVKLFNLMFSVNVGAAGEVKCYLKPETTQSSVLDFLNVYRSQRGKLPLKIAQIGKSFRNEISPRQVFIRMREFSMAELQIFFNPENTNHPAYEKIKDFRLRILPVELRGKNIDKEVEIKVDEALKKNWIPNQLIAYYLVKVFRFFEEALCFDRKFLRFKELFPEEKAHYSKVHWDFEIYTEDFGWQEVVNNSWRSDYDLSRHQQYSKHDLTVFENDKHILPEMYEPSFGLDRIIFHLLIHAFKEEKERKLLSLPRHLAPYDVAVFPLVNKDGLTEKALEVVKKLEKNNFSIFFDKEDSIGRRYRRVDEIGISASVTIDYQTLEDSTVTLRDRDTMKQVRVKIRVLPQKLKKFLAGEELKNLGEIVR